MLQCTIRTATALRRLAAAATALLLSLPSVTCRLDTVLARYTHSCNQLPSGLVCSAHVHTISTQMSALVKLQSTQLLQEHTTGTHVLVLMYAYISSLSGLGLLVQPVQCKCLLDSTQCIC